MIIDYRDLSPEALQNLMKEYCLRDWGLNEVESPIEARLGQIEKALREGKLLIQFSEEEQSAHIIAADVMGLD